MVEKTNPVPGGGILGNTRESATSATAAREQAKKEWYNTPFLDLAIALALILIALVVVNVYDLNLFWGLVVGGAIVWIAGKLSKHKVAIVKRWGVILRVVGWVVLVTALVPSGLRYFAEFAVEGANSTLCRWSGKACGGAVATSTNQSASGDAFDGKAVEFNLVRHESLRQVVGINTPIVLIIPRAPVSKHGEVRTTGCAKIVAPPVATSLPGNPVELDDTNAGLAFETRLSKSVRDFMADNGISRVTLEYSRGMYIWGNPECP